MTCKHCVRGRGRGAGSRQQGHVTATAPWPQVAGVVVWFRQAANQQPVQVVGCLQACGFFLGGCGPVRAQTGVLVRQ